MTVTGQSSLMMSPEFGMEGVLLPSWLSSLDYIYQLLEMYALSGPGQSRLASKQLYYKNYTTVCYGKKNPCAGVVQGCT